MEQLESDEPVVKNPNGQEQVGEVVVVDLLLVVAPLSEADPNFCE